MARLVTKIGAVAAVAAVAAGTLLGTSSASAEVKTTRTLQPDNPTPSFEVNLPDTFRETRAFDGQRYFGETVKVAVKNNTGMDQVANIRYADQQGPQHGDGLTDLWIAGARVDSVDSIIKAGETQTVIFDVWFDHSQGRIGDRYTPTTILDVPDDLTLEFGFELKSPAVFITDGEARGFTADMPSTLTNPTVFDGDGKHYYKTQITVPIANRTNEDRKVTVMYADQQEPNAAGKDVLWIERGVFDTFRNDTLIKAGETKTFTFDVWYDKGYTAKQVEAQGNKINLSKGLDVAFGVTSTVVE